LKNQNEDILSSLYICYYKILWKAVCGESCMYSLEKNVLLNFFLNFKTFILLIIGTIFLFVCLLRVIKHHFASDHHFGFEAAA
jgi:hypothetical protein